MTVLTWNEYPQVRNMDQVSEAQGPPIGHDSETGLTSTFVLNGAR